MYPRTNYEMTEEDLKILLDTCKPTACMLIGGYTPATPQENANRAWAKLGQQMGFDSMTVHPISGKGDRFFTAIPNETEDQQKCRIEKETEEKKAKEIECLKKEILERQIKSDSLEATN